MDSSTFFSWDNTAQSESKYVEINQPPVDMTSPQQRQLEFPYQQQAMHQMTPPAHQQTTMQQQAMQYQQQQAMHQMRPPAQSTRNPVQTTMVPPSAVQQQQQMRKVRRQVLPFCPNGSNPYHTCTNYCYYRYAPRQASTTRIPIRRK